MLRHDSFMPRHHSYVTTRFVRIRVIALPRTQGMVLWDTRGWGNGPCGNWFWRYVFSLLHVRVMTLARLSHIICMNATSYIWMQHVTLINELKEASVSAVAPNGIANTTILPPAHVSVCMCVCVCKCKCACKHHNVTTCACVCMCVRVCV